MSNAHKAIFSTCLSIIILFAYIYTDHIFFWFIICISTSMGIGHFVDMLFLKSESEKRMKKAMLIMKELEDKHREEWEKIRTLFESIKKENK